MGLLYDMNDCYSKLRELVPGIPQGSKLSQVEILQHVIDYIFDLQIVLVKSRSTTPSSPFRNQTSQNCQQKEMPTVFATDLPPAMLFQFHISNNCWTQ
ncbi:unnamed protein product [Ranitomeya imitator]|uniref:BHLH domain-containing protein n=1 Tax=Ranitomeya imitator TaxID=111125 RepID=A0ABN9L0N9_9NEOB|nr:unnamed protein product [Ranitomeya imitator]